MCFSAGNSQRPRSVEVYRATIATDLFARHASQVVAPNPRFNSRGPPVPIICETTSLLRLV